MEYSSVFKTAEDFNPRYAYNCRSKLTLFDSLYVYSDFAFSDGNPFVGNDGAGNLAANEDYDEKKWNYRLNLNFRLLFLSRYQFSVFS